MPWTFDTKNSTSVQFDSKYGQSTDQYFLNIGSGFNLLLDATNKLEIQQDLDSTWVFDNKQ